MPPGCAVLGWPHPGGSVKFSREETPWNYCDYRCQICKYQHNCQVYLRTQVERQIQILEGRDPDDWNVILGSLEETFRETADMVRQEASRLGIDLDEPSTDTPPASTSSLEERERDPLVAQAMKLTLDLMRFIQQQRTGQGENPLETEAWEDLTWHHTLFGAKLARALAGLEDADHWHPEWRVPDYQVSAGIALKSLDECHRAIQVLRPGLAEASPEMDTLQARIALMRERIHERLSQRM